MLTLLCAPSLARSRDSRDVVPLRCFEVVRLEDGASPVAMYFRTRDASPQDTSGGFSGMQKCSLTAVDRLASGNWRAECVLRHGRHMRPVWFGDDDDDDDDDAMSPILSNRKSSLDLVQFECKSRRVLDHGVNVLCGGKSGVSAESLQNDVSQSTVTVDG